jgi:FtsP/CotA-like multicopper oxidase with cupredoxin domain
VIPFTDPLFRLPKAMPVDPAMLVPGPDPMAHQRYNEFTPQKFYVERLREFKWRYSSQGVYGNGSWAYGFANGNGAPTIPGAMYHARYGEPVLVRRYNELPPVGTGNVPFALPSVTIHLHNGHTASESDGIPTNFFNPGEYWDYHYANFPAGFDYDHEIMSTLWYHDHRLDFTAPNVYAGLSGIYHLYDELDSNNEQDRNPRAFRLPSGDYDIPLILHDVQFDQDGQPVFDFFTNAPPQPVPANLPEVQYPGNQSQVPLLRRHKGSPNFTLFGMLGDTYTVNRTIQPYLQVEARKYRFRVLNGGPSRLYNLSLRVGNNDDHPAAFFHVLTNDGNMLEAPLKLRDFPLWVANRTDVVIDFSAFTPGTQIYLVNNLGMRDDGAGPNGKFTDGDRIMRFDVIPVKATDKSRIPDELRPLPPIDLSEARVKRTFVFDYDNGLWTVNGRLMDPNRIDAKIEMGTAEIWTIRNGGNSWAHPVHSHFEEFQIIEINGKPVKRGEFLRSRKDVIELWPNMEVTFFGRWRDFEGIHVTHCHNVVHEDHEMMIQWKMVPRGEGDGEEYNP